MKEHSQNLQWRSLSLASYRTWTVGLWGPRPRCFQRRRLRLLRRRKQSSLPPLNAKQTKPYRRRALLHQRSWIPDVFFNINLPVGFIQNCTSPQNRFKTPSSTCGSPYSGSRGIHRTPCQSEVLAKYISLGVDSKVCQDKPYSPEAGITGLSLQRDSLASNRGGRNNDGKQNEIIILNNSTRKYCCRGLKQHGSCGLLIARRTKFNQCTLKRSPFMMHKKLSLVKFRIRIAKSLPKLRRGKTCKVNRRKLSWAAKVTRDWQEAQQAEAFAEDRGASLPSRKSKPNSPWDLFCFSDMNSNMPGPLIEESQTCRPDACLTQERLFHCRPLPYKNLAPRDQNGIAESCLLPELQRSPPSETEALPRADVGEMPSLDNSPEDIFIVTEKEISVSGHDEEASNQVMGSDEVVLESSKLDLGTSDGCSNGPVVELVQSEDCRSQMEVESPISTDVFGTELLDHLYCKSPLDEPLRGGSTGQKSGTPKGGKRSSQKMSCVNDEQLAAWLCGICLFFFLPPPLTLLSVLLGVWLFRVEIQVPPVKQRSQTFPGWRDYTVIRRGKEGMVLREGQAQARES